MDSENIIDVEMLTAVSRAIDISDELDIMATHLAQLLVGALGLKGCTIFVLNPDVDELEILASFGLSIEYLNKGPVLFNRSIGDRGRKEAVVIRSTSDATQLQYPDAANKEGIGAMVSLPILFKGSTIGALRLYHEKPWDVSERDLRALQLLAEIVGLAMTVTRLGKTLQTVREAVETVHLVWLE
ncbi:MAG: GAF domain-containing protein [Desulfobacteraceae bacterium]|jgi:transcriptional regulator with GAF, ATPase, and Fis domain|nr:GAF domain-containing protein [Desulfobacteraceae bacterium]